jgi:hypothetical protein
MTVAYIRIKPSLLGIIRGLAFRQTGLYLRIPRPDQSAQEYRLVPRTLPDGILISSVLHDSSALADLWLGAAPAAKDSVRSFRITTLSPREWTRTFQIGFAQFPIKMRSQVVRLTDRSGVEGRRLVGGRIDLTIQAGHESDKITGWFDVRPADAEIPSVSLAVKKTAKSAVLVPFYNVARPDVMKGIATPALSGFCALVPHDLWKKERTLLIVELLKGSNQYAVIGILGIGNSR